MVDFFERASSLRRAARPFATATVVRIEAPTSGKPGDRAIITLDGQIEGWIGGSCARPAVVAAARKVLAEDRPHLLRLVPQPTGLALDGVEEVPMTCASGGSLDIFIEPHPPAPRLLVVGHEPVAGAIARLARAMGWSTIAADAGAGASADAEEQIAAKDLAAYVHPLTFVVVATHGNSDLIALSHALRSPAPYVALVASRKRAKAIRDLLKLEGLSGQELEKLTSPAGLDIGARRPEEIALSILAEAVQIRRDLGVLNWEAGTSLLAQGSEAKLSSTGSVSGDAPSCCGPEGQQEEAPEETGPSSPQSCCSS